MLEGDGLEVRGLEVRGLEGGWQQEGGGYRAGGHVLEGIEGGGWRASGHWRAPAPHEEIHKSCLPLAETLEHVGLRDGAA